MILTNNVEASVEFADAVSGAPLTHLSHICPFVQMRVEALHTGQRRDAIISPDRVHIALMKTAAHQHNQTLTPRNPLKTIELNRSERLCGLHLVHNRAGPYS